jgi:hypothetical protein
MHASVALVHIHRDGAAKSQDYIELLPFHLLAMFQSKKDEFKGPGKEFGDVYSVKDRIVRFPIPSLTEKMDFPGMIDKRACKGNRV